MKNIHINFNNSKSILEFINTCSFEEQTTDDINNINNINDIDNKDTCFKIEKLFGIHDVTSPQECYDNIMYITSNLADCIILNDGYKYSTAVNKPNKIFNILQSHLKNYLPDDIQIFMLLKKVNFNEWNSFSFKFIVSKNENASLFIAVKVDKTELLCYKSLLARVKSNFAMKPKKYQFNIDYCAADITIDKQITCTEINEILG